VSEDLTARLSRWSQRKLAARRGETQKEQEPEPRRDEQVEPPTAQTPAAEAAEAEASPEDAPVLPPLEELTSESDYTVFLAKNVPETLRRAALRKLWRSDPVFANLDGLNDYDEDYHAVDTTITSTQISYQAGRGYIDEVEEKLAQLEPGEVGDESERTEPAPGPSENAAVENKNDAAVDDPDTAAQKINEDEDGEGGGGPVSDRSI
jgi:hypothetical protein